MSDAAQTGAGAERPRPQYGEYATPEEQRAHIRQPDPVVVPAEAPVAPAVLPAPADAQGAASRVPAQRPFDRVITAMLLGIGAVNVFFSAQSFFDPSAAFTATMQTMGIPGEFTNTAVAQTWGGIAAVSLIAGYLITALLAWSRLRAGRLAWWIPVVGAVVTYIAVSICLMVPLAGDPAFQAYISSSS